MRDLKAASRKGSGGLGVFFFSSHFMVRAGRRGGDKQIPADSVVGTPIFFCGRELGFI